MHLLQSHVDSSSRNATTVPVGRLVAGAALLASAWGFSWFGRESISAHTFIPLWLGYILLADAVVEWRTGSSQLSRNPVAFATLFVISIPFWWAFEAANSRLQNWHYTVPDTYGWPTRRIEQSLAFSTVLPALFVTSDLVQSTRLGRILARWRRFPLTRSHLRILAAAGGLMIVAVMLFPSALFPLVWIGGFLLIDPLNALGGRSSLLVTAGKGRWTPVIVLAAASLICGFLWEMWNVRASARWTYDIPAFEWLHLFEMPLLGYGGYIPFAFTLYAAYHLITAVLPDRCIARLMVDQRGNDSRENALS